jgi:hypothetical protein
MGMEMKMKMETIKVKIAEGKILAKSAKSEAELEFYPATFALCAKGHAGLPGARLLVPADPVWWLEDDVQKGEWVDLEFTRAIAGK